MFYLFFLVSAYLDAGDKQYTKSVPNANRHKLADLSCQFDATRIKPMQLFQISARQEDAENYLTGEYFFPNWKKIIS